MSRGIFSRARAASVVPYVAVVLLGCGDPTTPVVFQVSVTPSTAVLEAYGARQQFTARALDDQGNAISGKTFTWSSSDVSVAAVTADGSVTAVSEGTATISATVDGVSGGVVVTVEVVPTAVQIGPETPTLVALGETVLLSATGVDALGNPVPIGPVTWSTADETVVLIAPNGLATAVSEGTVSVTATAEEAEGETLVTVRQEVASLVVSTDSMRLGIGNTSAVTVQAEDARGHEVLGRNVTWASSNPSVASVDAEGTVRGVGEQLGQVAIQATVEGITGQTVLEAVTTLRSVAAGGVHTCAVTTEGDAYCWGRNDRGQLGTGDQVDRSAPTRVQIEPDLESVTAGRWHTCVRAFDGRAYCWGENAFGELGTGAVRSVPTPEEVVGGHVFTSLRAGQTHTCGVVADGAAYCWGGNHAGQLGNGSTMSSSVPVAVTGDLSFDHVTAGNRFTCGRTTDGTGYCWGSDTYGQLGSAGFGGPEPIAIDGGLLFSTVDAGSVHACGATTSEAAYCWGRNSVGQLGDGGTTQQETPVPVTGGLQFVSVVAGRGRSCGRTPGGSAYCWGSNAFGLLGTGSLDSGAGEPVRVAGEATFASMSLGDDHTCAVTIPGGLRCWGSNLDGILGDGTQRSRGEPVRVLGSRY